MVVAHLWGVGCGYATPSPGYSQRSFAPRPKEASAWAEEEAADATTGDPAVIEDLAAAVEGKGAEALGEPEASTGTR